MLTFPHTFKPKTTVLTIVTADFNHPDHAKALVALLNEYACDPMGGGAPLAPHVRANLAQALAQRPGAHALIAYQGDAPAGLAIAFEGFSTFACQPLLNLHDFMVAARFRGQGIAQRLLAALEALAQRLNCCKITLEVLDGNATAQALYRKAGFASYTLMAETGGAQFWQKSLAPTSTTARS